MRYRESGEARLGLGADAGRAFVAYLAARSGRSSRKRRDGGRMIVRFDFEAYRISFIEPDHTGVVFENT